MLLAEDLGDARGGLEVRNAVPHGERTGLGTSHLLVLHSYAAGRHALGCHKLYLAGCGKWWVSFLKQPEATLRSAH